MRVTRPTAGSPRSAVALAVLLLVTIHLAFALHAAVEVAWTADELNYLGAGHALWTDFGFVTPIECLHGPLPFLANHLFVDAHAVLDPDAVRTASRLGMLGFSVLLLLAIAGWSRELWGRAGMLLSLALAALSPALIGYAALLAVDVALASATTLLGWCAWRAVDRPSLARAGLVGVCAGIALATKYLALLFLPFAFVAVLLGGWRRARLMGACGDSLVAAIASLLALHACYGFSAPALGDVGTLTDPMLQRISTTPILGELLGLLPGPFVRGVDYQLAAAGHYSGSFGSVSGGHPAYFVVTLLTKTPIPELLLVVASLFARARWPRGLSSTLVAPLLGVLTYLSFSRMQLGVRYVLPLLPLLQVFAGRVTLARTARSAVGRIALVLCLIWIGGERLVDAPHHLSWFNQTVGRAGGMELFGDSNCDWGQDRAEGERVLRQRWSGVTILAHDDGPRFGLMARYVAARKRVDPKQAGRVYDWLARFEPVDRYLAAWLVYEVSPDDFRRAIDAGDTRAAGELVLAFLRGGERAAAEAALPAVSASDERATLRTLLDQVAALEAAPHDPAVVSAAVAALAGAGLLGPAASAAAGLVDAPPFLRWRLRMTAGELPAVYLEMTAARAARPLSIEERALFAQCAYWSADFAVAVDELDRVPQPEAEPLAGSWRRLRADAARESIQRRRLFGR